MPPEPLIDLATIDLDHILADREAIRLVNPQRYELEQLDAVVYFDPQIDLIIGYKDVRDDEFWVRGHMPGYPLLPGILMCEASAQLCSYFSAKKGVMQGDFLGFGGMEKVRFRSPVRPGDRLVLVSQATKINRRQMFFDVQGFVKYTKYTMVFHGDIIGMSLSRREEG